MIIDPNRSGIELFYDDKIRNLVGDIDKCIKHIILLTCEYFNPKSSKEFYGNDNIFTYKGKRFRQFITPYLDCNGIGAIYRKEFFEIGYNYNKVDVRRINL